MRRVLLALLGVVLAFTLGGCPKQSGGSPERQPNPPAAQPPRQPLDPNLNHPGQPQPDPGGCQQSCGDIAAFLADWVSETKVLPTIEYTLSAGGAIIPVPANEMQVWKDPRGGYHGAWEHEEHVKPGQVIGFTMFGTPSFSYASCVISYEGQFHSPQSTDRHCASSYTVF